MKTDDPSKPIPDPDRDGDHDSRQFEWLLGEYVDRLNSGEQISPEKIAKDHPEYASELLSELEIIKEINALEGNDSLGTLGDYTLRRRIGRGGMGVVYEAWENSMDRQVALKVLPAGIAADDKAVARFSREARLAGKLNHENIVRVFSTGVREGTPWYSMEYVEGETLAQFIARAKDSEPNAETAFGTQDGQDYYLHIARCFADVADGLQHAHSKGVIHRDIKPSNLILDAGGRLRILDFGLARLAGQESLTMSGALIGTPLYMSPEQACQRKIPIDHRTDIYSLGATMYEAVCGRPPFKGKDHQDTLSQIIERDPVEPRKLKARVPKELEIVVLKCLRKDVGDRYGTAEALGQDLRRFVRGDPIEARPQGKWERASRRIRRHKGKLIAAAILTFLIVCIAWLVWQNKTVKHESARKAYEPAVLESLSQAPELLLVGNVLDNELLVTGSGKAFESFTGVNLCDKLRAARASIFEEVQHRLSVLAKSVPERPEAHFYRAKALFLLGREAEARKELNMARRCRRDFIPTLLLEAERQVIDASEEDLLKSVDPAKRPWLEAPLALRKGEFDAAVEAYGKVVADIKGQRQPEPYLGATIAAYLGRGLARLGAEDYDGAIRDLQTGTLGKALPGVRLLVGKAYHRKGERTEGERVFEELYSEAQSAEEREEVALWVVTLYGLLHDYQRGRRWSSRAPAEFRALLEGAFCIFLASYDKARLIAAEALKDYPDDPRLLIIYGNALLWIWLGRSGPEAEKKRVELFQIAEKVVELDPKNPEAWALLAETHRALGNGDKAIEILKAEIRRNPDSMALNFHLGVIICLLPDPDLEEAKAAFRRAIELEPENPVSYGSMGWLYNRENNPKKALYWWGKSLETSPEKNASIGVANALKELGRYEEAVSQYRKAAEDFKESALTESQIGLADTYYRQGFLAKALNTITPMLQTGGRELYVSILESLDRIEEAIQEHCRKLVSTASHSAPVWKNAPISEPLARLLRKRESRDPIPELDTVVDALEAAFDKTRQNPHRLSALALARLHAPSRQDFNKALAYATLATETARGQHMEADTLSVLGEILFVSGRQKEGIATLEAAERLPGASQLTQELLASFRGEVSPNLLTFGSVETALGQSSPSIESESELLTKFLPTTGDTDTQLCRRYLEARVLQRMGRSTEAKELFRKLIESRSEAVEPHLRLAECLVDEQEPRAAVNHLQHVLSTGTVNRREMWDHWATLCFRDLDLKPEQLLAQFPDNRESLNGYGADLRWLLEKLSAGKPVRIDCGTAEDWTSDDATWGRDRFFRGGRARRLKREIKEIYRSERLFPLSGLSSGYHIPLPCGTWQVTLHFAEIWFDATGVRRFDVAVEGMPQLEDFEPYDAENATPKKHTFAIEVTDGMLDVKIIPRVGEATISAVEIARGK